MINIQTMHENQKTAIVTGAYGAIGQAIAAGIAMNGYRVILVGRDSNMLENTRKTLVSRTGNNDILVEAVDLGLHADIASFSRRWKGPLHLLVNNAATAPRQRTETSEGIEVQWATNVLAYFRMTQYFHPFMENIPDARIVNVASYWAGGLNLSDPEFKTRTYDNDKSYRQAKQANRMISAVFAERLIQAGITVNSCHPGDVNSKLSNAFGFGGSESPEEGAATPLYLSLSKDVQGITGKYYEHLKAAACPFSADRNATEALFRLCESAG